MAHINFITDLPEDEGCSTIMTVVDRFSKIYSFVPLSSTTAASVVTAFFKEVVVHYALKTNLYFSTVLHPQTDGMAQVSNRTLGQLLCIHCGDGRWVKTLPLLALMYNATPYSRTRQYSYFIATGRQPALPVYLALRDLKVPAVSEFLLDISRLW